MPHWNCPCWNLTKPSSLTYVISLPGSQKYFSYIAIHAKPDDAAEEISSLVTVYDEIIPIFGEVGTDGDSTEILIQTLLYFKTLKASLYSFP